MRPKEIRDVWEVNGFTFGLICLAVLAGCAEFNTAMDIADIFVGDPIVHKAATVTESKCQIDATGQELKETSEITFDDGSTVTLPGCHSGIEGDRYQIRESETKGYYLDKVEEE